VASTTGTGTATNDVLEVNGLVVSYGARTAVDGVSLDVRRGEIFGLLGPNGAGKTSTLSAIEGLLKPQGGAVMVDGIDIQRDPSAARARLGVQLQASNFQPELTIEEIARLFAGLYGLSLTKQGATDRIRDIGLGDELGKRFKSLSGGQQQRLSLLIAVIHDSVLLLLDEPTSGLDPQSRRQLWDRIEQLRAEGGSILLTTHSMEEAQAVCDRVAVILGLEQHLRADRRRRLRGRRHLRRHPLVPLGITVRTGENACPRTSRNPRSTPAGDRPPPLSERRGSGGTGPGSDSGLTPGRAG
jgi:ABC-2 type transport system ATP-binding protein